MSSYHDFLVSKSHRGSKHGFDPVWMPDFLFDFQRSLVEWSVLKGRAAIFADCGTGKTPMQLVWAQNMVEHTNRHTLILTPLAVAQQTAREASKFGIPCARSAGELPPKATIIITNYEKLHHFKPEDFSSVVCDESSAIKAFNGERRSQVTAFLRHVPYRLLCTATAAPNDYTELGTSSEALGEMGYTDMLNRFFVDDQNRGVAQRSYGVQAKFRFKGHAETPFWRWVCSWARACRKPSDLGFSDDGFTLPPLIENEHVVETKTLAPGMLFALPARDMREEREERRRTIGERCEYVASLVSGTEKPAVVWCHLNDEADLMEKIIKDGRQVSGSHSDEKKEKAYEDFSTGNLRVLIIKPKVGAWGLNWQHCAHVVTFASHSYEQHYQAIRRCWRFGQKSPVTVDLIASEGEQGIKANLARKSASADRMFGELVAHMNDALKIERQNYNNVGVEVPSWL